MQYSYSKEMCTGWTEPIRIIGGPDNKCPENWISTVFRCTSGDISLCLSHIVLKVK